VGSEEEEEDFVFQQLSPERICVHPPMLVTAHVTVWPHGELT
jgi:hypothetical protein